MSRRVAKPGSADSWILRDCSLELHPGTLTAIVGPSGAGKTSLLYCLSGLDRPDGGTVEIDEVDVYRLSRQKRATFLRTRVGFVFQQYNLIPYLTVAENVLLPASLAGRSVSRAELAEQLARFGLSDEHATPASALSGGEQQRAALCRAMVLRPAVVFADEPTGALDTVNSQAVLRVLRELAAQGMNVVMVTHNVDAAALADRVVFMRDGTITGGSERSNADEILARMREPAGSVTEGRGGRAW